MTHERAGFGLMAHPPRVAELRPNGAGDAGQGGSGRAVAERCPYFRYLVEPRQEYECLRGKCRNSIPPVAGPWSAGGKSLGAALLPDGRRLLGVRGRDRRLEGVAAATRVRFENMAISGRCPRFRDRRDKSTNGREPLRSGMPGAIEGPHVLGCDKSTNRQVLASIGVAREPGGTPRQGPGWPDPSRFLRREGHPAARRRPAYGVDPWLEARQEYESPGEGRAAFCGSAAPIRPVSRDKSTSRGVAVRLGGVGRCGSACSSLDRATDLRQPGLRGQNLVRAGRREPGDEAELCR